MLSLVAPGNILFADPQEETGRHRLCEGFSMEGFAAGGLGWQPDLKDSRDYQPDHPVIRELLQELGPARLRQRRLPTSMDLREYFSAARNQGNLNASTAFAVLSLVEYFDARAKGRVLEASRLFLYQMTMKLLGLVGNAAVDQRSTFKALVRFGSPPDTYWPYAVDRFHVVPTDPFLFSFAREYEDIHFFRLDDADREKNLQTIKSYLAAGFAVTFGFPVPSSMRGEADIPFRPQFDSIRGGQAVLAVGYDDKRRIASETGALLFRSSWGSRWGDDGYGWLPYNYVTQGFALDFWTMLRTDWAKSGILNRP